MSDFLRGQTGGELAGWLAYLRVDDEVQTQRLTIAMMRAFGGGKKTQQSIDEDEKVIDTTKPEFAEKFKGFINKPLQPQRPMMPMQSTQILRG